MRHQQLPLNRLISVLFTGRKWQKAATVGAGVGVVFLTQVAASIIADMTGIDIREASTTIAYGLLGSLIVEGWSQSTQPPHQPPPTMAQETAAGTLAPTTGQRSGFFGACRATIDVWEQWHQTRQDHNHEKPHE